MLESTLLRKLKSVTDRIRVTNVKDMQRWAKLYCETYCDLVPYYDPVPWPNTVTRRPNPSPRLDLNPSNMEEEDDDVNEEADRVSKLQDQRNRGRYTV